MKPIFKKGREYFLVIEEQVWYSIGFHIPRKESFHIEATEDFTLAQMTNRIIDIYFSNEEDDFSIEIIDYR